MNHIELTLTDSQAAELLPLVRQQVSSRRGLLLVSVAPFLNDGTTRLRLQAQYVRQPAAAKILKLMHQDVTSAETVVVDAKI